MTSRADTAAVDLLHALCATLFHNFRRKIDLVMWRTNAGAELRDQIGWIRSEALDHLRDRVGDDAELGPSATGMNQTDGRSFWIDNVNRAAIGDVNAQHDSTLIGDDAIAAAEFAAHRAAATIIDNSDLVSVNLLSGKQRPIADADCVANFAMRGVEPI